MSKIAVLSLAAFSIACGDDGPTEPALVDDIIDIVTVTSDVSTLQAALQAASLETALKADGPFTVFAPVNSAFNALGADVVAKLLEEGNLDALARILTFHVVPGAAVFSSDLSDGQTVTTLEGGSLTVSVSAGAVTVNGATVIAADIEATNGVIHLVDAVMLPELNVWETGVVTPDVHTVLDATEAAALRSVLEAPGPITVFAPVNSAFAALDAYTLNALLDPANIAILQAVLGNHVLDGAVASSALTDGGMVTTLGGGMLTFDLSGATPMVNGANIIATDIETSNGVIHLVDAVLMPELNIVATAAITEATSTLVTAVVAGGLVETLSGDGPFTVFAPINDAFAALDAFTLETLLDSANIALLQKVLTFHVISGDVRAAGLSDGLSVATVEGSNLTFDLSGATPMVNGTNIIATDIVVGNGVIHLVDGVLLPEFDIVETATITEGTSTLAAAVAAGDLVSTLSGAGPFTVFAPINDAFAALGTDKLDVLLDPANIDLLRKILTYHVVSGDVRAGTLTDGQVVATVEGSNLTFDLSGATPMVNGANIIATDIVVGNGVIHLIDGVLTENADIVDVATLNGFSTLVTAVVAADLETTLRSDNSGSGFTVFAPTNDAFAALDAGVLDALLADIPALQAVLKYHVVSGTVPSSALTDGQVVTTVEGSTFTVNISGSDVSITDGAGQTVSVAVTDVPASNGVVHVISGVVLPS
jgi:uncharacterized surface protein with fasciclin (FAS1) repeats